MQESPKYSPGNIIKYIILAIVIGACVNIFISLFMDRDKLFTALRAIRIDSFLVPFLCYFGWYIVNTLRLLLVSSQFNVSIPFSEGLINSAVGLFVNNLTPMTAGGQPFQIYHLQKMGLSTEIATNIILSRFVEQASINMCVILAFLPRVIVIGSAMRIGGVILYIGLGITMIFAVIFLFLLIRPDSIGKFSLSLSKTFIGKLFEKVTKNEEWAASVLSWSRELREQVRFLWKEKLYIMVLDILLGCTIVLLKGYSLYYLLNNVAGFNLGFIEVTVTFVIIWHAVFYVPTPGGSGSIEAGFALAFAGLTGEPELTFTVIVIWRLTTYYAHIILSGIFFFIFFKRIGNPGG